MNWTQVVKYPNDPSCARTQKRSVRLHPLVNTVINETISRHVVEKLSLVMLHAYIARAIYELRMKHPHLAAVLTTPSYTTVCRAVSRIGHVPVRRRT